MLPDWLKMREGGSSQVQELLSNKKQKQGLELGKRYDGGFLIELGLVAKNDILQIRLLCSGNILVENANIDFCFFRGLSAKADRTLVRKCSWLVTTGPE